jgi:uncharacterized protein (TIGR02452 family)
MDELNFSSVRAAPPHAPNNSSLFKKPAFYLGALTAIALAGTGFVAFAAFRRIPGAEVLSGSALGYALVGIGAGTTLAFGIATIVVARKDKTQKQATRGIDMEEVPESSKRTSFPKVTYNERIPYVVEGYKVYYNTNESIDKGSLSGMIMVQDTTTLGACEGLRGKTAILNFANARSPGHAQEGALLGASMEYKRDDRTPSIAPLRQQLEYIRDHGQHPRTNQGEYIPDNGCIYLDRIAYRLPNGRAKIVATISCAAVDRRNGENDEYLSRMSAKVRAILLAAADNGVENLVLGAFGCGVFLGEGQHKGDPRAVAQLFKDQLEGEFRGHFKCVIFAIPGQNSDNYKAFDQVIMS